MRRGKLKCDLNKVKNIQEAMAPGQMGAWSVETTRENVSYLVECIHELLMVKDLNWLDQAMMHAMQGLLASPQDFGSTSEQQGYEKIGDMSVRMALALHASRSKILSEANGAGQNMQ